MTEITPEIQAERRASLLVLPGFIVLIKKPYVFFEDRWFGPVENSWSIGVEENRTQFWWSSERASSNLGGSFKIDGRTRAEDSVKYWKAKHPDWTFTIYDARDAGALPVVINWELWLDAESYSEKTMSGVKNKHEARNLRFHVKGEHYKIPVQKTALPLTAMATHIDLRTGAVETARL